MCRLQTLTDTIVGNTMLESETGLQEARLHLLGRSGTHVPPLLILQLGRVGRSMRDHASIDTELQKRITNSGLRHAGRQSRLRRQDLGLARRLKLWFRLEGNIMSGQHLVMIGNLRQKPWRLRVTDTDCVIGNVKVWDLWRLSNVWHRCTSFWQWYLRCWRGTMLRWLRPWRRRCKRLWTLWLWTARGCTAIR